VESVWCGAECGAEDTASQMGIRFFRYAMSVSDICKTLWLAGLKNLCIGKGLFL